MFRATKAFVIFGLLTCGLFGGVITPWPWAQLHSFWDGLPDPKAQWMVLSIVAVLSLTLAVVRLRLNFRNAASRQSVGVTTRFVLFCIFIAVAVGVAFTSDSLPAITVIGGMTLGNAAALWAENLNSKSDDNRWLLGQIVCILLLLSAARFWPEPAIPDYRYRSHV